MDSPSAEGRGTSMTALGTLVVAEERMVTPTGIEPVFSA